MDNADQGVLNALSSHEKREQARKAKEEAREQKESAQAEKEKKKSYLWITITIIVLIAFAFGVVWLYTHRPQTYTDREVHWHASVDISICGVHKDLPRADPKLGTVHGEPFKGIPMLHTHDDNVIHIEGLIQKKEDIMLGRFMDVIGVPFSNDTIMDKKNGDLCPDGRPGVLKMYVNDQPRTDFREYVPFAVSDPRKQVIKLVFEPEGGMMNATETPAPVNVTPANATPNMTNSS